MSLNVWMDNQAVAGSCNRLITSNEKEYTTDTHSNMDEPQNNHAEWKKSGRKKEDILRDSIYIRF